MAWLMFAGPATAGRQRTCSLLAGLDGYRVQERHHLAQARTHLFNHMRLLALARVGECRPPVLVLVNPVAGVRAILNVLSRESNPNFSNEMMSNFGCAVSGNLAAMIANPGDLVSGREPSGIADPVLSNKAIESYRAKAAKGGN